MPVDHSRAPLIDAVRAHRVGQLRPFIIPGHKGGRGIDPDTLDALGASTFSNDISLTGGVDDLRMTHDLLGEAERLAADAFGADRCFFLVNGSTIANQIALLAAVGPGDEIIVGRNAHKSMHAALVLSGARPVYVHPHYDSHLDLGHGVLPTDVEQVLWDHPGVKAAALTSPTYFGVSSDLLTLAALCHQRDLPLIIDEAWAAHFPFHPDLPPAALAAGADVAITSIHKMLGGLSQASMLSLKGQRVDVSRTAMWVNALQTTSPAALIMASIDGCRRQMVLHGRELLQRCIDLVAQARTEVNAIPGLHAVNEEIVGQPGVAALDPTKLVITLQGTGWSGYAAEHWLRSAHQITLEMCDSRRIVATISYADDAEGIEKLIAALRELARTPPPGPALDVPHWDPAVLRTEVVLTPREAAFSAVEAVPLHQASGRIVAETVTPYPPGIPLLVAGERATGPIVDYLLAGLAAGMDVRGLEADTRVRVVCSR